MGVFGMYNEYYNIKEIIDGVYHISDPNRICCTLIVGGKKALLFDTGYGIGDLKELSSRLFYKIFCRWFAAESGQN